jgi:hypothetical protein
MLCPFHVTPLSNDDVVQALPLIQLTWPTVDEDTWLGYVRFVTDRGVPGAAGVLGLRDAAGYICGLAVYELDRDLREGSVLTLPLVTAVDLANSTETVEALLDTASERGADLGCVAVQIRLDDDQTALAARVRGLGFIPRAGYLWRSTQHSG